MRIIIFKNPERNYAVYKINLILHWYWKFVMGVWWLYVSMSLLFIILSTSSVQIAVSRFALTEAQCDTLSESITLCWERSGVIIRMPSSASRLKNSNGVICLHPNFPIQAWRLDSFECRKFELSLKKQRLTTPHTTGFGLFVFHLVLVICHVTIHPSQHLDVLSICFLPLHLLGVSDHS